MKFYLSILTVLLITVPSALFGERSVDISNPEIEEIAAAVSEARVEAILNQLQSFQTRNLMSSHREGFGIKAAAEWIHDMFKEADPRLKVRMEKYALPPQGGRVVRETELINVVAELPGRESGPEERIYILNAHYDSLARSPDGNFHFDNVDTFAPGANDDGSGIAGLIETARAFKGRDFAGTVIFIAFSGEEMGLIGSTVTAQKMKQEGRRIAGVITMDMIGNIQNNRGMADSRRVRIFSEGPEDSLSRALARRAKRIGELYFPVTEVDLIFRADRFGRGGDHTPFVLEGFPGIRMTEAVENYDVQHSVRDTVENVSIPYCTRNIRLAAALLASLAGAPPAPEISDEYGRPMIGRGESGFDAHLQWKPVSSDNLAGYRIYRRKTTSPFWESVVFAGKVTEFLFDKLTIDDNIFGVSAVDLKGNESPVSAYVMPSRARREYTVKE